MAVEQEVGSSLLGSKKRLDKGQGQTVSAVKAALKMDNAQVRALNKELDVLRSTIDKNTKSFNEMAKAAQRAMGAAQGATGAASGGTAQNGMPLPPPAPQSPVKHAPGQGGGAGGPGGGAGINTGGNFGGLRAIANQFGGPKLVGGYIASQMAGQAVGAIDNRVNRGIEYALPADRLSVLLQQQYGKSQMQVMQEMRQPLAQMRLGAGGINSMLQFQSQTGQQATSQIASSIAGIRALNGYSKTTADVLADQRSIMDPAVANRMLFMTGTNAYTYNGKMRDPMQFRQSVIQNMGLSNDTILRGALNPGSVTRARMADAGFNESMQTEIIQQAQMNQQFKRAGGSGMYDPSKKEHRKLMGIEDNFATQVEETDAKRTQREEQFMERQVDNYAKLEKNTQQMVGLLSSIEDKMSSVIGARTSSRGWQRIGGRLLQAGGLAMMATGVGAAAGAGMFVGGTALSGDPVDASGPGGNASSSGGGGNDTSKDSSISIPVGYGNKRATLNEVKQRSDFRNLKPQMQEKLLRMFRANPNVGIGGGFRDSSAQEAMFRDRYRPTSKKTNIFWEGQYWEHVKGAAAAPPGKSMHEIGLAADLVGDLGWMNANAGRFGLKHFAGVNNEPWHVQPAELPNSRSEYEKGGAQWGSGQGYTDESDGSTPITTGSNSSAGDEHGFGGGGAGLAGYGGMSISQILDSIQNGTASFRGGGGSRASSSTKKSSTNPGTKADGGTIPVTGSGAELAARAAFNAGFRGEDLFKIVAIAGRESSFNPGAINKSTSDRGMWQINYSAHKKWLASELGVKTDMELLDVNTNAKAAYWLYKESGFRGWKASASSSHLGGQPGWDPTGNEMWNTDKHQSAARAAVDAITGDPMPKTGMMEPVQRGGSSMMPQAPVSISPSYQISIAPVIKFESHGGPGGVPTYDDLKKIASQVGALLREEVKTLEMRTA